MKGWQIEPSIFDLEDNLGILMNVQAPWPLTFHNRYMHVGFGNK